MANVLLNALASTAGGGITYLRNVLPRLRECDVINHYFVLVPAEHINQYRRFGSDRLRIDTSPASSGLLARLWWEQTGLRDYIKSQEIEVIVSLGNFALFASPVPQILFNRNDLYFSDYFKYDLKKRGLYRTLISHRLKSRLAHTSIKLADINIAPTKAFADRIHAYDGLSEYKIEVLHFGFDHEVFAANKEPLPSEQLGQLNRGSYRLLYVSHYNYFRNFETLIRALPIIKKQIREKEEKDVQLVLTTDIKRGAVYGGYDATFAAELIDQLGVRRDIAMLDSVPYEKLHQIYDLCDAFVCPSYSESFGHPLLEAIAMGLPVIAANLDVHREVCGEAAVYFDVFDERDLAAQCVNVLVDHELRQSLRARGWEQCQLFSWDRHTRRLVALINQVLLNDVTQLTS